ncbi:SRPBCC family protein [Christiangramia salexigens]|uniref:Activator of Hsp90 ATPase homologue 1/2-like C-terminal domain-containing protein n=1 Tax=Christiangramia salexigens TaxID=1913577 RepID=A0A1L3J1Z4_9FLAO|nr:SRPBCC domain-containing protein [Christiangramia salexigens]APG59139.1 hypothetical protein LPB144_01390 [Christiangramia salexigens]
MDKENKTDWTTFKVEVPIKADPQRIKDAWSTQETLEKWFLKSAEFTTPKAKRRERNEKIHPGDIFLWRWHGWPDATLENGEIIYPEKDEFLRFIFGKTGTVGVSVLTKNDQTILSLVQENIPEDERSRMDYHVGCKTGWTFYLLNLKSFLLGGPDLRNKDASLSMD